MRLFALHIFLLTWLWIEWILRKFIAVHAQIRSFSSAFFALVLSLCVCRVRRCGEMQWEKQKKLRLNTKYGTIPYGNGQGASKASLYVFHHCKIKMIQNLWYLLTQNQPNKNRWHAVRTKALSERLKCLQRLYHGERMQRVNHIHPVNETITVIHAKKAILHLN